MKQHNVLVYGTHPLEHPVVDVEAYLFSELWIIFKLKCGLIVMCTIHMDLKQIMEHKMDKSMSKILTKMFMFPIENSSVFSTFSFLKPSLKEAFKRKKLKYIGLGIKMSQSQQKKYTCLRL